MKLVMRYSAENEGKCILPFEYASIEKFKGDFEKTVKSSAKNGKVTKRSPGAYIDGSFILLGEEFNCKDFLKLDGRYFGPEVDSLEDWFDKNKLGKK